MGKEIENSLRVADGRAFTAGHVLSKIGDKTRGIATKNSKIWSVKRDSLQKFIEWCDHLHSLIHLQSIDFQIPRMGMLAKSEIVSELPEEPIALLLDDIQLQQSEIKLYINEDQYINPNFKITVKRHSDDKKRVLCNFDLDFANETVECIFNINGPVFWQTNAVKAIRIVCDNPSNRLKKYNSLDEFLQDYPPLIILHSGKSLKNNILFTPQTQNERFDQGLFDSKKINWDDTDVFKEAEQPERPYKYNVQDKTLSVITPGRDKKDFFFIDDSSGEVADIIWFNITDEAKTVCFIHCKFKHRNSKKDNNRSPNADKRNITDLIDQGLRCGYWIKSPNLLIRLLNRLDSTQKSKVLFNREMDFRNFESKYEPFEWKYKVILVQPGLDKKAIFRGSSITNIEKMLVTLLDRTRNIDAELEVWGNES
jgi:hypothetical protein